ncbi:hypothetical protein HELRODRAFT_160441 [Helobdella robusta]|uniref:AATF leucine zipper-containing domain-containing protein n=1 Tax=Helobdella robusta TaxID=6412 RepID=T1EQ92_HELRO|nr:hypothetical protein HELRODRAFT_160441 [Helobdella robusta]ESO06281.1 hypothetical protein HELRODRAFT_160441 [Helobdella robusta]
MKRYRMTNMSVSRLAVHPNACIQTRRMIRIAQKDFSDSSHEETFGGFYDVLLDMRMQQQEVLADVNKLPQNAAYMKFRKDLGDRFTTSVDKADKNLSALLNNMLKLQKIFTKHDGITMKLSSSKSGKVDNNNADDEEIVSDEDDEMAGGEDNLKEDDDEEDGDGEDDEEEDDEDTDDVEEDGEDVDEELDDGKHDDSDNNEEEGDDNVEKIRGRSSNIDHIGRKIRENYSSFDATK